MVINSMEINNLKNKKFILLNSQNHIRNRSIIHNIIETLNDIIINNKNSDIIYHSKNLLEKFNNINYDKIDYKFDNNNLINRNLINNVLLLLTYIIKFNKYTSFNLKTFDEIEKIQLLNKNTNNYFNFEIWWNQLLNLINELNFMVK